MVFETVWLYWSVTGYLSKLIIGKNEKAAQRRLSTPLYFTFVIPKLSDK